MTPSRPATQPRWVGLLNNPSDGLFFICRPCIAPETCASSSFLDDHGPPHVHVFSGGGEAKLLLGEADRRPALAWARGMDRGNLRRALAETLAHRGKLILAWRRVHGSGSEEPEED